MADNVAITAGSGTTIATDDIGGGVQVQRVKPVWGADGVGNDTSDTNPMPVSVRQPRTWFEIDVPGVANTAHAAGDTVGTIITITNAARASGGTGVIESILYFDNDDVVGGMNFYFFNASVTLAADDAAFAVSDADARKAVALLNMTYVVDLGVQRFGQLIGLDVAYTCVGTTSLFLGIQTVAAATFTGGATGQHIAICMTRD